MKWYWNLGTMMWQTWPLDASAQVGDYYAWFSATGTWALFLLKEAGTARVGYFPTAEDARWYAITHPVHVAS